jgi:hypothetical protein
LREAAHDGSTDSRRCACDHHNLWPAFRRASALDLEQLFVTAEFDLSGSRARCFRQRSATRN